MALTVFPAEMYKDDMYRVVHGPEEATEFERFGWTGQMPIDKQRSDYTVWHEVDRIKKEAMAADAAKLAEKAAEVEAPAKRGPGRPPKDTPDDGS